MAAVTKPDAIGTQTVPVIDPTAPLLFLINGAAGSSDADARAAVIDAALATAGRQGRLTFCAPAELAAAARQAAAHALRTQSAVVAVGGDGTINTVAQAVHAAGGVLGVIAQGTFNYFARTHGIPEDPAAAASALLKATAVPVAVQVAALNGHVFLVNASLGLYPDLLQDREAYKARFGRSRWVAFGAACATLLRAQRPLKLHIAHSASPRVVRTMTLFVGNNRLQLQQLGLVPEGDALPAAEDGSLTAVMLRPVGTWTMLQLMLRGALGTLGEAPSVEHFRFSQLAVQPSRMRARRSVKVAFDGEVTRLAPPLDFRVHERPLWLLKSPA